MAISRIIGNPKQTERYEIVNVNNFMTKPKKANSVRVDAGQTKPNDAEFVEVSAAALGAEGFFEGNHHAGDAVSEKK
jgi:hypothetical protein